MSDYLAKQMFGENAIYGMARIVIRDVSDAKGLKSGVIVGIFIPKSEMELPNDGDLYACEIYIVPVKKEPFRGRKHLRVDQILFDYHFQNAFGECVDEEHSYCPSCKERGFKVKKV